MESSDRSQPDRASKANDPSSKPASRLDDHHLTQRLEDYYRSLQAGKPAVRPDWLAEFPEMADELSGCLDALEYLHAVLAPRAAASPGPPEKAAETNEHKPARRILGDFAIGDEVGRGGMGVVYEAEQVSLKRRVALKIFPAAALLAPKQLQRFRNEATAAARLEHSNIVQVYSVGCERGVHYYAMQFIEGQTLAQVIRDLRGTVPKADADQSGEAVSGSTVSLPPSPRQADCGDALPDGDAATVTACGPAAPESGPAATESPSAAALPVRIRNREFFLSVAYVGIQAAEALEHAHQAGIIHRDVKPSNLLLDTHGHVWVTDFGLALDRAEPGLTMTGDLVGTLRYMSPEQARSQRNLLDHRTDIYSLGATLYEFLTLRPPFWSKGHQQLLEQLKESKPVSPRQLSREIPRDLETIVLKCLEKNPAARYATARDLAEDLQRFLEGRPIQARPIPATARLWRWCKRNPTVAVLSGSLLALTVLLAMVGPIVALREASLRRDADQERHRAEANFQKAREAVDRVFTQAAEEMDGQPQIEPIRRKLLENALEFYQGFLRQKGNDPTVRYQTALAYYRVGHIYSLLGQYDHCRLPLDEARSMLETLVERNPRSVRSRLDLAAVYFDLAYAEKWAREFDECISDRRRQLALYEQLQREYPSELEYLRKTASSHSDLGTEFFDKWHLDEAIDQFQQALAICRRERELFPDVEEDREVLAHIHHWLGASLKKRGQMAEAETHLRTCCELRTQLVAQHPQDIKAKFDLSHSQAYLADLLTMTARAEDAEPLFRKVVDSLEQLIARYPDVGRYRQRAAVDYEQLGCAQFGLGRVQEAEASYDRCLALRRGLHAQMPDEEIYQGELATGEYCLAVLREATGRSEEAADGFREALRLREQLLAKHPDTPEYQYQLGWILATCPVARFRDPPRAVRLAKASLQREPDVAMYWQLLGIAQYRTGDAAAAVDSLAKVTELPDACNDPITWLHLAMAYGQQGRLAQARAWYDKSVAWLDENRPPDEEYRRFRAEAEKVLTDKPPPPEVP